MLIIALILLYFVVIGCIDSGEGSQADPPAFVVVDSLLAPPCEISEAGIMFNPPEGFVLAHDTILEMLKRNFANQPGVPKSVELVRFYLDTLNTAGLIVSIIEGMNLKVDTAYFMTNYRQFLFDMFGEETVEERNHRVNGIFVKEYFVNAETLVRFQLLCLSNEYNSVELTYFVPRNRYPDLVSRLKSSMGSLKLTDGQAK